MKNFVIEITQNCAELSVKWQIVRFGSHCTLTLSLSHTQEKYSGKILNAGFYLNESENVSFKISISVTKYGVLGAN